MDIFYFIVQHTIFFMTPLVIVALGGLFSEKSGVVNIALEGKMIMGAFTGVLFITTVQRGSTADSGDLWGSVLDSLQGLPGHVILLIGLVVAMATGIVVSLFHAYASIHLKANQIISGVAINMFAPAFAVYAARRVVGSQNIHFANQFRIESIPGLGAIPFIGPMFFQNTYITTYIGLGILVLSAFVLYKTKFGLRLRACGEHPHAADSVGVSVVKMRYAGVIISGALAGIGGLVYIVPI